MAWHRSLSSALSRSHCDEPELLNRKKIGTDRRLPNGIAPKPGTSSAHSSISESPSGLFDCSPKSWSRLSRHSELKHGATRCMRTCPQPTSVHFDNRTADRQPESQAVRFGGIESFEELLERRWGRIPSQNPPRSRCQLRRLPWFKRCGAEGSDHGRALAGR